jgi:hypothetical protein
LAGAADVSFGGSIFCAARLPAALVAAVMSVSRGLAACYPLLLKLLPQMELITSLGVLNVTQH